MEIAVAKADSNVLLGEHRQARVADILVDILVNAGVDVVFGIPGGTIAPVFDALIDRREVRIVTTQHEAGAMFAAAGYARASGKLGVVLVTSGPGVLNAVTGLASAFCDGLPVLLLIGEVPREGQGRQALQDGSIHGLNIIGGLSGMTKLALEVPTAGAASMMLRRAIATALSGKQGPVAMTLPMDTTSAAVPVPVIDHEPRLEHHIHDWALAGAAEALTPSRRSLIFAGSGCRFGDGPRELRALAEQLQLPVMTTLKAKGVFPESHELSLGVYGPGGHPSAYDYVAAGIDTLLVLGASLGQMQTDSWSTALQPRRTLIQVDVDAMGMGRNYTIDLAITAPVGQFCAELRRHTNAVRRVAGGGIRYHTRQERAPAGRAVLPPDAAIREIQRSLPPDTIYCVDNGEHQFFATHYLRIDEPDGFLAMTGLGSMGCSIGGAIGVQLAKPSRTVAVLCGDGGFSMFGNDIATAAELGLPLVFCVLNNGRFGMVEHGHEQAFGRQPGYALGPHDVRAHAISLGAEGAAAAVPGAIGWALRHRPSTRPIVLDIQINPLAAFAKNDRISDAVRDSKRLAIVD